MKKLLLSIVMLLPTLIIAKPLDAQKPDIELSKEQIIKKLQNGGNIIYFRHAQTNRQQKDQTLDFENCKLQRNLSIDGINTSKKIGNVLSKLNIPITNTITSPYCRCKDTAKLALGSFNIDNNLRFSITSDIKETQELKSHLQKIFKNSNPKKGENIFIVAHTSNLKEAVGIWPKPEAVMVVFEKKENKLHLVTRIKPSFWENF